LGSPGLDIRFGWGEVEKVERTWSYFPWEKGVRVTLTSTPTRTNSRKFAFGAATKRRAVQILDFAEERGASVDRRARFTLGI